MDYDELTKVADDDPWRCQSSMMGKGQCHNKATKSGGHCLIHGGAATLKGDEKRSIRNYRLDKFKAALNRHADSPRLKTLNDEVAILRMMLEEQLNQCQDTHDLVLKSHLISDLVVKIEKLVKSCHNLESSLGGLLDKQAILAFATRVIDVITDEIEDEDILTKVSQGILKVVDGKDE